MQQANEDRPPPQRRRITVQIIARRFLRHCSRLSNRNRSELISTIQQRAQAALLVFSKLENPIRTDCPYVQQIIVFAQEIIETIQAGIRSATEGSSSNISTWTSLLYEAKASASEISKNLANVDDGLTEKFTSFLSDLIGDVQAKIARIDDACTELFDSNIVNKHSFAMTHRTSQQNPARDAGSETRNADSRDKISLPRTGASIYLCRIF